jgi:hypothetical protein
LQKPSWKFVSSNPRSLLPVKEGDRRIGRRDSSSAIAGGEDGEVGRHDHVGAHLWATGIGPRQAVAVARRRPCGWRRGRTAGRVLRRSKGAREESRSFRVSRGSSECKQLRSGVAGCRCSTVDRTRRRWESWGARRGVNVML